MQSNWARHAEDSFLPIDDLLRHSQKLFAESGAPGVAQEINSLLSDLRQQQQFQLAMLALYSPDQKTVAVLSQSGEAPSLREIPISAASLGSAINEPHAIEVHDAARESRFPDLSQSMKASGFHSFRIVPVSTVRYVHGVLILGRRNSGEFAVEHAMHSDQTAKRIALLLENSLITDLLVTHKAHLNTLFDVNTALASTFDIQQIFERVSSTVRRVIPGDYTSLAVYDKPADAMSIRFLDSDGRPVPTLSDAAVPLTECPAGVAHRQAALTFFSHADLQLVNSRYTRNLLSCGIRSMCHLPLICRGKNLGTLGLASLTDDSVPRDDVVLLTQIASQVALAVDNARAHDEIARFKDKLSTEKLYLEDEISAQQNFGEVVGNSAALCQVLRQVEIAAPSDATVLILGETGTGKELIARSVHRLSSRREGNFIKLNCAAIPTGLLESELFGHEKGAFTGAISQKIGPNRTG